MEANAAEPKKRWIFALAVAIAEQSARTHQRNVLLPTTIKISDTKKIDLQNAPIVLSTFLFRSKGPKKGRTHRYNVVL